MLGPASSCLVVGLVCCRFGVGPACCCVELGPVLDFLWWTLVFKKLEAKVFEIASSPEVGVRVEGLEAAGLFREG